MADRKPSLGGGGCLAGRPVVVHSPDCTRLDDDELFNFCSFINSLTTFLAIARLYSSSITVGSSTTKTNVVAIQTSRLL